MSATVPTVTYNTQRMVEDMAIRGWGQSDLARRAKVSEMTVTRFLRGDQQTAKTCKRLAAALGYTVRRYVVRREGAA